MPQAGGGSAGITTQNRPWAFWMIVVAACVVLSAQGVWLAQRMVSWDDESAYVHLGYLVVHDGISLFQNDLTGSRMPLPFWIIGTSQLLAGRSLLAARMTSLMFAVVALVLTAFLA